MLDDIVSVLACPHCGEGLSLAGGSLTCAAGHSFDVARQGYANLLPGNAQVGTADTPAMVEARDTFLSAGHFAPISAAVAQATSRLLADGPPGCVVEVGAGTGHYLAAVLEQTPLRPGIALDISKAAARRAAGAHPRIGAVVCDAWRTLPMRTGAAALVLDVFAPRNAAEFARVLDPDGALVVVTPTPRHLAELIGPLGLLTVDPDKPDRLATSLSSHFECTETIDVEEPMALSRSDVLAVAGMGPSAHHADPAALATRVASLSEPVRVTLSVLVSVFRPRGGMVSVSGYLRGGIVG